MGQSAAEKTRGSPERYEAIETAPGHPERARWSPNRSSRNQSWGVAPIRSRAKMQVDDRTRTRRHRSSWRRRRAERGYLINLQKLSRRVGFSICTSMPTRWAGRAFSMAACPAGPAPGSAASRVRLPTPMGEASSSSTTRLTTPSPWLLTCWSARPGVTTAARAPQRLATDCRPSAQMVATGSPARMACVCSVRCITLCAIPWPGC